jgi:hypothetical protein
LGKKTARWPTARPVALVDEEYLYESIVSPNAKVAQGFNANAMPSYSYLRDAQVYDLIEFIKTLE